jgi:EpsI family protein
MPFAQWKWLIALSFALALKLGDVGLVRFASRGDEGSTDLAAIPLSLPDWQGRELPVPQEQIAGLGREAVLQRDYVNSAGQTVSAAFIYSRKREGLHLPENCLVSQGWTLLRGTTVDLKYGTGQSRLATSNLVVGANPRGGKVVELYLFADADKTATDWGRQYLDMVKYGRAGGKTTCLLLLTATVPEAEEYQTRQHTMQDLMSALLPYVHRSLGGTG